MKAGERVRLHIRSRDRIHCVLVRQQNAQKPYRCVACHEPIKDGRPYLMDLCNSIRIHAAHLTDGNPNVSVADHTDTCSRRGI